MADNLFKLETIQYATILKARLQQMGSKLRGKVMEGSHTGKMASPVNYVGPVQLRAPAGKFAPLNRQDADYTRRWVFPQPGEIPQLIDSFEQLETIVDPKSELIKAAADAVGRGWDDALIANALGIAQTGTDNSGLVSETFAQAANGLTGSNTGFLVADTFGAGASSIGMTVGKLIEARRLFEHFHVDLDAEPACLVIGSQQHADLYNQVQVTSSEFNGGRAVLSEGRVRHFLGFDIVVSERLTVAAGLRQCLAFVKSGLYLGIWQEMVNDVDIAKELSSHPIRLYTKVDFGATRLEPGRLLQINCADTAGADITP